MFKKVCSGNHNLRFWEASIETFIDLMRFDSSC